MLPTQSRARKYAERPSPCGCCGSAAWWNGVRIVAPVQKDEDGEVEHHPGVVRRRVRCSSRDCPIGSWTVYEEGAYPHRTFQLDVVASAVLMVVLGGATLTAAGDKHKCGRDTMRRWRRWVSSLAEPRELEKMCARLDPDGMPSRVERAGQNRAAQVLWLLERLADLLTLRGVPLPRLGAGLSRLLRHLFDKFGDLLWLTKSSPPLRADWASLRP
jgi:transposase-like protein